MPLYEYRCMQCTGAFSELRSISEMDFQIDFPECDNNDTQRFVSAFSVGVSKVGMNYGCAPASSKFK